MVVGVEVRKRPNLLLEAVDLEAVLEVVPPVQIQLVG
jgi:hypothetical protein